MFHKVGVVLNFRPHIEVHKQRVSFAFTPFCPRLSFAKPQHQKLDELCKKDYKKEKLPQIGVTYVIHHSLLIPEYFQGCLNKSGQ
jgi:hypothetical protein